MARSLKKSHAAGWGNLPGFAPTMGYTLLCLLVVVLVPLSTLFFKAATLTLDEFVGAVAAPRVLASYRVTFGAALLAAVTNAFFGVIVAWTLVRYRFPGRRILDALVDLPFALPTAVAGITLAGIFASNGWLGKVLEPLGVKVAFTPVGIWLAMVFIGLPFVVRTVQPVLQEFDREAEEAAACLGGNRWQICTRVVFPLMFPAVLTGFTLAFARAVGEYGSIVFIAGNMPMVSEITPLLIITKLEQYDYAGATAVAVVMLLVSFMLLLVLNLLQKWSRRYAEQ
ncbi:sulfate ABC transporter permease subunit CysT [Geomonas edaphica]|uniref:sulfate ABC transporter permease subunit CysT n=1 Tax=Geomonas edaphica TaxID=2570226 RepID=UPI0010A76A68|nr:sulfate ABC transporter permease subunit CysT [Geomonas edaphica]